MYQFHVLTVGCLVNGAVGDGTTKGTCSASHQVCNVDGSCTGKHVGFYWRINNNNNNNICSF